MGALQRQIFRTRKSIIGRLRRCAPSTAGRSPIGTGTILIASSRIVAVGGSATGAAHARRLSRWTHDQHAGS